MKIRNPSQGKYVTVLVAATQRCGLILVREGCLCQSGIRSANYLRF